MIALLRELSWPELRHHPWRSAAALLAVMLGVALAFSVHLINQSALSEFSSAVRSVNGDPDFELRAQRGGFDEALYERVAAHPQVALASPVVDVETQALNAQGQRVPLRVLGLDALVAAPLSPALLPQLRKDADRFALFDPQAVFLNASARQKLGEPPDGSLLRVQTAQGLTELRVQGSVAAGGAALAVMDIAGAQAAFGWLGRLSRIDVRLQPGADRDAVLKSLALPEGVRAALPDEAAQRVSNLSRAYRVNLTVLALVAMFTGAFLVFSILSLSVAKRQPQLALLGVLGMTARQRLKLVLLESALLGWVGSVLGLALGTALAALALRLLAGDLGGGYFPGVTPALQFSAAAAAIYGGLGVVAAVVGGWVPARAAQRLAPAQALKGLGDTAPAHPALMRWLGPAMLVASVLLALLPPALVSDAAAIAGVLRVEAQRVSQVQIDPRRAAVFIIARPLADPAKALPLVGDLSPLPAGETAAYVSEAMVSLYGASAGSRLELPLPDGRRASVFVRGVWRDYARQFGAVTLAAADYQRLTGDTRINDLALWLQPGADLASVQRALRERATARGFDGALLEFASVAEIRSTSLRIFDRSFAVTYWLQAVAIAIGLFGIAASFSAQVLARRKEFGLLAHLGLTRAQVLTVVAVEGAVWTATGALLGLLLGLAVSVVLVHVVNPQSFHWTMDLLLPWGRLGLLCAAVVVAGTATAWLAARSAAGRQMALAVKEDW